MTCHTPSPGRRGGASRAGEGLTLTSAPFIRHVLQVKGVREPWPLDMIEGRLVEEGERVDVDAHRLRVPVFAHALDPDDRVRLWLVVERERQRPGKSARDLRIGEGRFGR